MRLFHRKRPRIWLPLDGDRLIRHRLSEYNSGVDFEFVIADPNLPGIDNDSHEGKA